MPKYLISANYTAEGMAGVRAAGAKSRVDAVTTMIESMGGRLTPSTSPSATRMSS